MKVRLKKWSIQGEQRWVVEWTLAGKRTRRYFRTKKQAESEAANVNEQFMGSPLFLPELLIGHEPTGLALTRPSGTLSRRTGEGRGEGRLMGRGRSH